MREEVSMNSGFLKSMSLLLIPLYLCLLTVLLVLNISASFNPPILLFLFNFLFLGLIPLYISAISFKSFQHRGLIGTLLMAVGMEIIGLGAIGAGAVGFLQNPMNMSVTIQNTSFCIGALFLMTGILLNVSGVTATWSRSGPGIVKPALLYGLSGFLVALLIIAAILGITPPFYVQGSPTILREIIILNAIEFFAIASGLSYYYYHKKNQDFFFWYSVGLALLAIGLLAVHFPSVLGSPLGWLGRSAQYLGACFILLAALSLKKSATRNGITTPDELARFFGESETSYKVLVDTAPDAITVIRDNRFLFANDAALSMFGIPTFSDLSTYPVLELVSPDDRIMFQGLIHEAEHGSTPEGRDIKIIRQNHSDFDVSARIAAIEHTDGPAVLIIFRDITENKKNEAALKESESRYRIVADNTYDFEFWINPEGQFVYASPSCERIYGRENTEFLADSQLRRKVVHPDDIAALDQHHIDDEQEKRPGGAEFRIIRPDGTERWISHMCQPVFDEAGTYLGVRGSNRDITGRKEMEQALSDEKSRNAIILEGIADTFYSLDNQWRFTTVNPAAERAPFEKPAAELLGRVIWDLYPGIVGTPIYQHYLNAAENHTMEHYEAQSPLNRRWYEVFMQGWTGGVDVYMRDVTERKSAEEELREVRDNLEIQVRQRTSELEKAVRSLGTERRRLYGVLETLPVYVCLLDEDYHMPFANRYFRETFNEPHDRCCYDFLFNRTEPCEICETYTVMKTHAPHHWYWTGPNGRDYDIYDFPFIDTDGTFMILEMGIDITEQKKAEEEIKKANAYHRSLIEASLDPLVTINPDGTISDVNEATIKITGFPRQELIGTSFSNYFTEPAKAEAGYQKVFRDGSVTDYALELLHREGHVTPVLYNATVFRDETGTVTGIFAAARDVTERRKAEEALLIAHDLLEEQVGKGTSEISKINISLRNEIEERRRVEKVLRETSQYLENLINYANAPIVVWNPKFRITRFNQAFERLTGMTAQEVIGKTPEIFIPETYRPEAMDRIRKTSKGDRWEVVEIPILHKNGDIKTVLWNSATLYGEDGKTTIATIAQGQDITERKFAEEELRRSYSRTSTILESISDSFIALDKDWRFTYANRKAREYINKSTGEIVGKTIDEVFPTIRGTPLETFYRRAMVSREPLTFTNKSSIVKGRDFELHTYPMEDGLTIIGQDATERNQAEEALIRKENELRNTLSLLNSSLESTADGILVVDNAKKITSFNQNFLEMWKIPRETIESRGEPALVELLLTRVKNPSGFLESARELNEHHERESYDMVELKDGRIFERFSKPQKLGNSIVGRVWSYRDVTDRKRAEQSLIESLREKEILLREIHHRVKNNLQLVSGLLDMTRMRTTDPVTHSILTDMMLKIQTMAQIHTRLYESKQFGRINIKEQIKDQISSLSNIYSSKGHDITCEINSEDIVVPVDQAIPCALVMNEILSNAYKHAFRGRRQGIISVMVNQNHNRIRIVVKDDGVGLPEGFDHSKTTSLGMKLIRTLMKQQLKGVFEIRSRNGTEVIIEFPLWTPEA
ncbi:MAG TPA: PAS domain S-box protein [Methanoregulaceae archaeon]|nr:PAS domain S-box protein [Methanoregulaceae archaeon]